MKQQNLNYLVNDEIKYSDDKEVRIVGNDIKSVVVTMKEAVELSNEKELDLIEINKTSNPPVLMLARYDKFLYDMKKNVKKNKQPNNVVKEIDIRVNIAPNDLETKVRQSKEFIKQGNKVKLVLTMRGRELSRREYSKEVVNRFIEKMEEVAVVEGNVKDEGNRTLVVFKKK